MASAQHRYRLGDELGRGALGRVVAVDDLDATPGAVPLAGKILHRSHQADPRAQARFAAEAEVLAGIRHPHLVAVHGLVDIDGESVLLMDRIDGPDLATRLLVDGPLSPPAACALGRQLAGALAVAHRAGVIHRDLKPGNVLLAADGGARLGDFGLARAVSFAGVDRDALAVAGTPDYMAPESLDPLAVDTRTDLYALGCVLCEAVTGAPPYRAPTAFALLEAHRDAPLPDLDGVPAALAHVIRWLLARSPADRPQSAAAVDDALAAVERELAGTRAASTALVPAATRALATRTCHRCGAPGIAEVAVCFACRAPQVTVEAGGWSVFVTGPGAVTHKLDSGLRQRLLDWLTANPGLGLDVKPLAREVPRLPFALAVGITLGSATTLARAITELGLQAEAARGGRFALPAMRTKAWQLTGRVGAILVGSSVYAINTIGWLSFAVAGPALALGTVVGGLHVAGRVATRRARTGGALSPPLTAALDRVAGVVPALTAGRHRDALRGAVERALLLRAAVPAAEARRLDPDLALLVDQATVAASRLDELETSLAKADLRADDAALREQWRLRDRWAARLLELTAFLDALRARWVGAPAATATDPLDELRDRVAALAEVEAVTRGDA